MAIPASSGIFQDAGEDADLAAGQTEGVGLLAFEDQKSPAVIGALGRVGDPPAHVRHQGVGLRVWGKLVLTLDLVKACKPILVSLPSELNKSWRRPV